MKTETRDVLYRGTGGELIRLMKEEKHSEAVIKAEVTSTTAHEKTLPLLFFFFGVCGNIWQKHVENKRKLFHFVQQDLAVKR